MLVWSVGLGGPPAESSECLGEGWEEETHRLQLPRPHSSANELQPDGGIAGIAGGGANREAGGIKREESEAPPCFCLVWSNGFSYLILTTTL